MKKLFIAWLLFACLQVSVQAQINLNLYPGVETFTQLSSGATPTFFGNGVNALSDEGYANYVPIGFNFNYNGNTTVNELSISTNGFISFTELTNAYVVNNLTNGALGERPIAAPLWDDLNFTLTTQIRYATMGTAPNRVFIVEWLNAKWGYGATAAAISFQVRLYETSNVIKFTYRQEAGNPVSPSASVGITSPGTGAGNFASLQNVTSTPQISTTAEMRTINSKPNTDQTYIFSTLAPTPVVFATVNVMQTNNGHAISWTTTTEINNAGFEVEKSADGRNFTTIQAIASKAINGNSAASLAYSILDTKPFTGANYYRIKQIDKDGKNTYSAIVFIKNTSFNGAWASVLLYPNPVKEKLHIQLQTSQTEEVQILVFNTLGQPLVQQKQVVQAGATSIQIPVMAFAAGRYTVQISGHSHQQPIVQSFIK